MVNQLSWYLKKGFRGVESAFQKRGLFFKYILYLFASFIGKGIFLAYPLFALADVKIVKEIEETGSFKVENAFADADKPKKYWITLVFYVLKMLFLAAGIGIILGIIALFSIFSFQMYYSDIDTFAAFLTFLYIIGIIAGTIFIIYFLLYLAPATYLLQTSDGIGICEVLNKSFSTMKNGKMKLFLIYLIHFLIFLAAFAIGFVILSLIQLIAPLEIVFLFAVVIVLSLLFILLPILVLANKIASLTLIKDLIDSEEIASSVQIK